VTDLYNQEQQELYPENIKEVKYSPTDEAVVANTLSLAQSDGESLAAYEQSLAVMKDTLRMGQETNVRKQIAAEENSKSIENLTSLAGQTAFEGDAQLTQDLMQLAYEKQVIEPSVHEAEKKAIETLKIKSAEDPIIASVMVENLKKPTDVVQVQQEMLTKQLIIQNEVAKMKAEADDQSWYGYATDWASGYILPFHESLAATEGVPLAVGSEMLERKMELMRAAPEEFEDKLIEYKDWLKEEAGIIFSNPVLASNLFEETMAMTQSDATLRNWLGVPLDIVTTVPIAWFIRSVKSVPYMMKSTGNADALSKATVEELTNVEEVLDVTGELAKEALPITDTITMASTASEKVRQSLKASQRTLDNIKNDVIYPDRLTSEELSALTTKYEAKAADQYEGDGFVNVQVTYNEKTTVPEMVVSLGTKTGSAFASERAAKAQATRRGIKNYEIIQGASGEYYIGIRSPIKEADAIAKQEMADIPIKTAFRRFLENPAAFVHAKTLSRAQLSKQAESAISESFHSLNKSINALGGEKLKRLEGMIMHGQKADNPLTGKEGVWFNHVEFEDVYRKNFGDAPTDKEIIAYYDYKMASDLEYMLRNDSMYHEVARQGFSSVRIGGGAMPINFNGKVFSEGSALSINKKDLRVYDAGSKKSIPKANLTPEAIKKLYADGKVLIKAHDTSMIKGQPAKYIMADKHLVEELPLNRTQLGYTEGGHRIYSGKYFVKQRVVGQFEDGNKYMSNPLTHINSASQAEATAWAKGMEQARKAYLQAVEGRITKEAATDIIQQNSDIASFDDFAAAVDKGRINADEEFKVLFDRDKFPVDEDMEDLSSVMSGEMEHFTQHGRMYYSGRGEWLPDANAEKAAVVSPFKALAQGQANATRSSAYNNFKLAEVDKWAITFSKYLDKSTLPTNATALDMMRLGKPASGTPSHIVAKMEGQRQFIQQVIGQTSKVGEQVQGGVRRTAEWLDSKGFGKSSDFIMDKMSSDPLGAARGWVYDAHLGLFNIGQLFLQSTSAYTAATISPKYGMKAVADSWFLRTAIVNDSFKEGAADAWARFHKADGFSEAREEFLERVELYRKLNLHHLGKEQSLIDAAPKHPVGSMWHEKVDLARQSGRWFAYEGDRWGRMTAFNIAYRELKAAGELKGLTESQLAERIISRVDGLNLNMTGAAQTYWQKNPLTAIPMQFWAYPYKMANAMLPQKWGGSAAVQGKEKINLAIGQMIMGGSFGIPMGNYMMDQYLKATGTEMSEEQYKTMSTGFFDFAIRQMTDGQVDLAAGQYLGAGGFLVDQLRRFSENPTLGVLTGTLGQDIGKGAKAVNKLLQFYQNEQIGFTELTELSINEIGKLATSWRNATKAMYIYKYGLVLDSKGQAISKMERHNAVNALAKALNLPSWAEYDFYRMIKDNKKYNDYIKDLAGSAGTIRSNFYLAEDEEQRNLYLRLAAGLTQNESPRVRMDVSRKTGTLSTISAHNKMIQKYLNLSTQTEGFAVNIKRGED